MKPSWAGFGALAVSAGSSVSLQSLTIPLKTLTSASEKLRVACEGLSKQPLILRRSCRGSSGQDLPVGRASLLFQQEVTSLPDILIPLHAASAGALGKHRTAVSSASSRENGFVEEGTQISKGELCEGFG